MSAPPSMPATMSPASPSRGGGGSGMGQLLGAPSGTSTDMQAQLDGATRSFAKLKADISSLSAQFPAASKDFDAASEAVMRAMMKVTTQLSKQQPDQTPAAA